MISAKNKIQAVVFFHSSISMPDQIKNGYADNKSCCLFLFRKDCEFFCGRAFRKKTSKKNPVRRHADRIFKNVWIFSGSETEL